MAAKVHDDDKDTDKGDDLHSLRERIARLEGQLAGHKAQAAAAPAEPTGPKYKVLNPHWSQFATTGHARESQLGGAQNVERLLAAGHIAPADEAKADAPKAE